MGSDPAELTERLAVADPTTVVEICSLLSDRSRRSLDLRTLRAALRRVRVRHAGNADVLAAIGRLYLRVGMLKEAQEALTQVVRSAPSEGRIFGLLGETLLQQGDARRAVVAFDQAIECGLDDATVAQRREEALSLIAVQDEYGLDEAAFQARELFGREPGSVTSSGPPATPPPDSQDDVPPDLYDDVPMTPPPLVLKPTEGTRYSVVPAAPTSKPSHRPRSFRRASRAPREMPVEPSVHRRDSRVDPEDEAADAAPRPVVPRAPKVPALEMPAPISERFDARVEAPTSERFDARVEAPTSARADAPPSSTPARPSSPPPPAPSSRLSSPPPPAPSSRLSSPPPPAPSSRLSSPPPPAPSSRLSSPPPSPRVGYADTAPLSRAQPLAVSERGSDLAVRLPSRRSVLVGVAALGIAGGGIALGAYRGGFFGAAGTTLEREEIERALEQLVVRSGLRAQSEARSTLERATKLFPDDAQLATWGLRLAVIAFLDAGSDPKDLRRALGAARSAGLGESHVAFAVVAESVGDRVPERLQRFKSDARTTYEKDAFYQLALGALCTRHGDAHAVDYYRQALRVEPQLFCARLRLITALLGDPPLAAEGRQLAAELSETQAGVAEVHALLALAQRDEADVREYAQHLSAATAGLADLPVYLRSQVRALTALGEPDAARAQAMLSIAVEEASTPASAAHAGLIALSLGHPAIGQFASQEALEMAPDYEPARALSARAHLFSGDLARAAELSKGLSSSAGGDLVGMLAYEDLDTFRLSRALEALPQGVPARYTLSSAVARLVAARQLDHAELLELSRTDRLWGNLIAIDAALDAGDLSFARELTAPWEAHPSSLQATRLARLLRYEGKVDAARVVVKNAAATEYGLIEKMMLSSDDKERQALMDAAAPSTSQTRKWLHVLRRGMDKSFPQSLRAAAALGNPGTEDALPTRVLCAYALMLNSDKGRAKDVLRPILKVSPSHPDAVAAGVAVGLLPASVLKRR